jgi:hypothetical protein
MAKNSKNVWFGQVQSDPKRQFRFSVEVGGELVPMFYIKTATKPKANVSVVEHSFLDHTFKYPGRVTWDPITLTLIDPIDPDLAANWLQILLRSGYTYPDTSNARQTMSKLKANSALVGCAIASLDAEGTPIEEWRLQNPFITSIDFGGTLDYTSDEMSEITVEIAYDYAKCSVGKSLRVVKA